MRRENLDQPFQFTISRHRANDQVHIYAIVYSILWWTRAYRNSWISINVWMCVRCESSKTTWNTKAVHVRRAIALRTKNKFFFLYFFHFRKSWSFLWSSEVVAAVTIELACQIAGDIERVCNARGWRKEKRIWKSNKVKKKKKASDCGQVFGMNGMGGCLCFAPNVSVGVCGCPCATTVAMRCASNRARSKR